MAEARPGAISDRLRGPVAACADHRHISVFDAQMLKNVEYLRARTRARTAAMLKRSLFEAEAQKKPDKRPALTVYRFEARRRARSSLMPYILPQSSRNIAPKLLR